MERHAVRHEPELMRVLQNIGGIDRLAAELARQRPFGAGAVADDPANHPAAGRGAGDLLHLGLAVDRKQRDAEREGSGDLRFLLDGVAVGDALGRRAGGERRVGLRQRGHVEAAAELSQQFQDFRRRIGLDGVEHLGVRQRLGEAQIIFADDVEIDHEAGSVIGTLLEEFADTCGHRNPTPLIRQAA